MSGSQLPAAVSDRLQKMTEENCKADGNRKALGLVHFVRGYKAPYIFPKVQVVILLVYSKCCRDNSLRKIYRKEVSFKMFLLSVVRKLTDTTLILDDLR